MFERNFKFISFGYMIRRGSIASKWTWAKRGGGVVREYNAVRNKPNTQSTSHWGYVFLGNGRKKFNPGMVRNLLNYTIESAIVS